MFTILCLLLICIGMVIGLFFTAYLLNDTSFAVIKSNNKEIKKNKKLRFTDNGDTFSDNIMENMNDDDSREYAEAERKEQTNAYNYASRK